MSGQKLTQKLLFRSNFEFSWQMAFEKRLNISKKIKIKPFHFMIYLKYYFISYFSYEKTLFNPVFFCFSQKTFDIIFVYLTALVFLFQNKCIYFIHNSTGVNRCSHVTSSLPFYDFYFTSISMEPVTMTWKVEIVEFSSFAENLEFVATSIPENWRFMQYKLCFTPGRFNDWGFNLNHLRGRRPLYGFNRGWP